MTDSSPFQLLTEAFQAEYRVNLSLERPDGSIDTGSIEQQARLTFANMQRATQAAGGSLENVTQVLIYMTDVADMDIIDKVYREFFSAPFPNRASVGVAALVEPGMKLEVVAYAMIP